MKRRPLLAGLLLAGCAGPGLTVPEPVRLPRDSVEGAGDPTRAAVSRSAFAFGTQAGLRARPGAAARAIADMEYLASALPVDPNFQQRDPLLAGRFVQARAEWRQALGIPAEVPAQAVIDSFYAVWRATNARDATAAAAAIPPAVMPPGGQAALVRLAQLPPLPQTALAASAASRVMFEGNQPHLGQRRL
ncbi:hypothetical protein [Roseococcus sp. YIM B11640]|uniref:hypothetical protein n=1 Tax=Roseococcus sp. YIM B11640 TaxID=3133973 RepID=UPI003C79F6A4